MYNIPKLIGFMKNDKKNNDVYSHWLGHHFMDWLGNLQRAEGCTSTGGLVYRQMAWQGTSSGKETWISYKGWTKAHFRDWAMENDIPREYWEMIFKEFLED